MDEPVIPPPADLLVQLRRSQHAVRTRLDADLAPTGLTTPQYTVMAVLEREGELSSSDLAREAGLTAQTMNVLVQGLEALDLIRRVDHPDHGRILLTSLTPAGRRALKRGRALALAVEDQILSDLTTAEQTTLMRCLKIIEANAVAGSASGRDVAAAHPPTRES
jgi:DNA-binding MarR family transcriptional regulator